MKKLILVMGHLAALKSTVAKQLSKDLDLICLNKDDMKEVLADTIGFADRKQNLLLSKAVSSLFIHLMERILSYSEGLILESNFKPDEISSLLEASRTANTDVYAVFMTGDPQVLYQRYVQRQPNRHPAHTSAGLMSYDTFVASMATFDQSVFGIQWQIIDTTNPNDFGYPKMLHQIKTWIENH